MNVGLKATILRTVQNNSEETMQLSSEDYNPYSEF